MRISIVSAGFVLLAQALAQQTVAPTPEQVGSPRGQTLGDYSYVDSFETGYRFRSAGGDLGKYRSDVNFGNGLRLLSSDLAVNSRDGHGTLFDTLLLRTQGLGNDPYQFSSLRVEKNGWYRYDLTWRLQDYYNPALAIAGGQHLMSTERRLQDHDLVLLPDSPYKLFIGYSRDAQDGPALSTIQLFDSRGPGFPLFENVRRLQNEYRLGGEARLLGGRFTVLHGWVNFSDTTPDSLQAPTTLGRVALNQFNRAQPYSGSSPYWRLNYNRDARHWAVGARWTYAGSRRSFFFNELAAGADQFGTSQNRQTLISGLASRPEGAGSLTLSAFPGSSVTITNQTSYYNTRIDGSNTFRQVNNFTLATDLLNFQFLGIRAISNATDATWRAAKWIGFYGGYHYSTRRVSSMLAAGPPDSVQSLTDEQSNVLHEGLAGIRLQPVKPLTVNLDGEAGHANHPFLPIAERDYHLLGARVQYKMRTVTLSVLARSNYNVNSVSLAEYSSRSRNYGANASWTPRDWFALDAAYSKIHLDTLGALAYFANGGLVTGDHSFYISNLHTGTLISRFGLGKRADLSAGYTRVQDVGDGRDLALAGTEGGSANPAFLAAQTFPLTFESPLARLSLRIAEKLRWNVGYQFYHYIERFGPQAYRAHTGYSSLLWSF